MDLPLPGVIGAAIGLGLGILDYGIVAALLRRALARRRTTIAPARVDLLMKALFVANAVAFVAVGWWVGVSVAGTGLSG